MPLDITDWKTPADIIANLIANYYPGDFVLGTNLFVGIQPDKPADCITVIDSGGGEQSSNSNLDEHSIQILCRNKNYKKGYNLLNLIKAYLQSIEPTTIDNEKIVGIWVKSNIAFIGRDESRNSIFSSNYRVIIETNKNINR